MLGTPFQQEILAKLSELTPVFMVGGAVRDDRLGHPSRDLDAVTTMPLSQLADTLREWGYHPHILGTGKQTVTVFQDNTRLDLSWFNGDIALDAAHRDFTINALYQHPGTGAIIDPYHGEADLRSKVLKSCGRADERFREDPVRILRLVRLAIAYGLTVEDETLQAAAQELPGLATTAPERITDELAKILVLADPVQAVLLLDDLGYFRIYIPELARLQGLVQNRYHAKDAWEHTMHVLANTDPKLLLRLAALFHDLGKWETASRECLVSGTLEVRDGRFWIGGFKLTGKVQDCWRGKHVEVRGGRLDFYPDTIQVKKIRPATPDQTGFNWVPDGKRHFLGHERESVRLTKQILPRFRWAMFLHAPESKGEAALLDLIGNHMAGTLTFMNELRGNFNEKDVLIKAINFAWDHGWTGRAFYPDKVFDLLALWRADFFGGKQREAGDSERFEDIIVAIKTACRDIEQKLACLSWDTLNRFAAQASLAGENYGRFKMHLLRRAVLDNLPVEDEGAVQREWQAYANTPSTWRDR